MMGRNQQRLGTMAVAVATSLTLLLGSTPMFAAPTSFGKWASRTQTLSVSSSADLSAWSSGASKWKNSSNFQVTAKLGVDATYYATDLYNANVDWDGNASYSTLSGTITKATLNLNTYFTNQTKYTSSIKAGVAAHEIGHSLGLNHTSVVETSSIMNPYTFTSTGSLNRPLSPASSDISVVNGLYPAFFMNNPPEEQPAAGADSEEVIHMHPSWAIYYANEAELAAAADLVVRGKVVESGQSFFRQGDATSYATLSQIDVLDIVKGDAAQVDSSITVTQMGGDFGNLKVQADGSTLLNQEQDVVLFLRDNGDGTYRPINQDDGIYVSTGGVFQNISNANTLHFSSLTEQ
ncbi:matrixin family metalloprotease [Paenibacillus terrigena]|uniref:matrixin family metalloprotease n=1 Tax=Paenibacillus terrigena TaxID=369333 RepID=UPI0003A367E4|nr:matrixin family metalloprotease [Paenibacillus terrigena]